MTEQTVYESRGSRSKKAIATYFRRIADALDSDEPVPADESQSVTVDPPAEPEFEVEVEREEGELSLEFDLEWDEAEGDIETDADASKAVVEVYEDSGGQWRWRLVHHNGNIIADSGQGYASKQKAEQGVESVKKNVPGAPVEDA